jgi:hypothetical protein
MTEIEEIVGGRLGPARRSDRSVPALGGRRGDIGGVGRRRRAGPPRFRRGRTPARLGWAAPRVRHAVPAGAGSEAAWALLARACEAVLRIDWTEP